MNLRSVIKNAIASRLEESQIQEVQNTPEVNNTFDFVKHLSEAIKFKLEELSIETLKAYKAKAEKQTKGSKGERRQKGINKAQYKIARKEMGLDRDRKTSPSRRAANLSTHKGPGSPEGRKPSSEQRANAAANRKGALPLKKVHGMGVGGKPAAGRPGKTKKKVLDGKLNKIGDRSSTFLGKIDPDAN